MSPWKRTEPRLMTFEAFGVPVQVALDSDELERRIRDFLPPGWRPSAARSARRFGIGQVAPGSYEVTIDDQPRLRHSALDVALDLLDAQIRHHIARNARDRIFVHAGVVADSGRALVLPGKSFSGKSTLVMALVEAGATYYSDEYAIFDQKGRIHPYPRRLSFRTADGTEERDVSEFGGVAGDENAELALIVRTQYRAGAVWQPSRVSSGRGLTLLLADTVPAHERPKPAMAALSRAAKGTVVLEGDRGEAALAARALIRELAALSSSGQRET